PIPASTGPRPGRSFSTLSQVAVVRERPCGGERMRQRWLRILLTVALATSAVAITATPVAGANTGDPGDPTITVDLNDSHAGGTYEETFELAYSNATTTGTPIYIYVPEGSIGDPTVDSVNPQFDHNPADEFEPC